MRALDEDEEFRLTVAAKLGIIDIKASIDRLTEVVGGVVNVINSMLNILKDSLSRQDKILEELRALREGESKLWEEVKALREENNKLWEEVKAIREVEQRHAEELRALREGQNKLWEENNKIWREIRRMRRDINDIRRTLDNLTSSIEEEANDVITHLLRGRGIELSTDRIILNSRFEFDVYGTNNQVTIIGEAKTRVGPRLIAKIDEKISKAISMFPDKFPGRVVKVIYCLRATPSAVEEAERRGIWLIESMKERTKLPL